GGQVGFAHLHGSGAETVTGEDAGDVGAGGQLEYREIASVRFADSGFGNTDFNAGDGENFGLGGDLQVNGHDFVSVAGRGAPLGAGKVRIIPLLWGWVFVWVLLPPWRGGPGAGRSPSGSGASRRPRPAAQAAPPVNSPGP